MKKINPIVNVISFFILLIPLISPISLIALTPPTSPTPNNLNTFLELINIFLAPAGGGQQQSSFDFSTPSPASPSSSIPSLLTITPSSSRPTPYSFVYFPQCDGSYDNIPIGNGCNLCQSGCGPTTVAMILSSLVDNKYTPDKVVNLYKQNNYYAGCDGTKINHAMDLLSKNGLKTTSLMIYNPLSNEAVADFKAYINNGWTIFALARFCSGGCGHYFWITDIDDKNNVWAYDPFYGRKKLPPPYNENSRYPFPQYRMAFGVKK